MNLGYNYETPQGVNLRRMTKDCKGVNDMDILAQNKAGIYCITNTINGKRYIGSSENVQKRIGHHFRLLGYGQHHNKHFQSSYNKYGKTCFIYSVLMYCDESELLKNEQRFIDTYRPEYNKNPIAGRTVGRKHSEATKEKLRNRVISEETRKRISLSNTGKKQTKESNEKRSNTLKGRIFSAEHLAKISAKLKGRKFTPEWLEKIRIANTGRVISDELREKYRITSTGRKHSEETKQKMSASQKNRFKKDEGLND